MLVTTRSLDLLNCFLMLYKFIYFYIYGTVEDFNKSDKLTEDLASPT